MDVVCYAAETMTRAQCLQAILLLYELLKLIDAFDVQQTVRPIANITCPVELRRILLSEESLSLGYSPQSYRYAF